MDHAQAIRAIRALEAPRYAQIQLPPRHAMSRLQVRAAVEKAERAHCISVARTGGFTTYAAMRVAALAARYGRPARKAVQP
jgi:hypothetical protein